jgi:hypothetical protein
MLHDVQRRRLLVEPPAEHPPPATASGLLHVELDKGTGQLVELPWRSRLAGAQAHDGILDADGLTRPERDVPGDAVALVEEPENRNPLVHRRRAGRKLLRRGLGLGGRLGALAGGTALQPVACPKRQRGNQGQAECAHPYSGVHA